ncbi:hypothetical protein QBC47DRAFT_368761 [Echria macrotheca]|uniref:NADH dehydrogenase [ubiquinone] iron-sulfur protein 5 n=1 Tax=Echria macrotheca TaxID=438768 RepID=A0AAJ0BMG4_9PEZI|nr:hypothetical protein QBC47DRAFT_368761 [Echria macrotheca]
MLWLVLWCRGAVACSVAGAVQRRKLQFETQHFFETTTFATPDDHPSAQSRLGICAVTMASGYGLHGGPSRCLPFWQELLACYVVNTSAEDDSGKKKCAPALEDYYECLHHKKEAARVMALQAAYRKAEALGSKEDAPTAGQIRSLGLVKPEDSK